MHLSLHAVADGYHDHLPLVIAPISQSSSSGAHLGHHTVHMEPQRVAEQQNRQAQCTAEDNGGKNTGEGARYG